MNQITKAEKISLIYLLSISKANFMSPRRSTALLLYLHSVNNHNSSTRGNETVYHRASNFVLPYLGLS